MIKLNCDLGEGYGAWKNNSDKEIMPYIDMANLACGFHAGDPSIMSEAIKEAKKNSIVIGAHPGYQDLLGFGRRSIEHHPSELRAIILYQIGALRALALSMDYDISYVKPHGALYNDMMRDQNIYKTILSTLKSYDKDLKLMILSSSKNSEYKKLADEQGIDLIYEIFADRNYTDEGFLVPRKESNAVIEDINKIVSRVESLLKNGYIMSINNNKLYIQADTICVHGDNEKALGITKAIRKLLDKNRE